MAEVGTIAVIGAGIMGRGIAHAAALGGYRTILEDILPASLRKAENEIRANLGKAVELGKVRKEEADAAIARIEYAGTVEEAARAADLVIEAVPEEMESKIEIFTLLDKVCRPGTIIASNTSSLSITEIASVTYRAPKCLGMHFFNPVHKMKLLEIVRALETDSETLAVAVEVGRRMGKEVVVVKESPGFITSRINAMIGNEAFYMLAWIPACTSWSICINRWAKSFALVHYWSSTSKPDVWDANRARACTSIPSSQPQKPSANHFLLIRVSTFYCAGL